MNSRPPSTCALVPLEAVVFTAQLQLRASRVPDLRAENNALLELARTLANTPRTILQHLVDTALRLCDAGSAGISIQESEDGQEIFRWHALSGQLASHLGETTPRHFSPCGTVLDLDAIQLMTRLYRHFTYFKDVRPAIEEALLIPFRVQGRAIGTVWVVAHDPARQFDAEDARVMASLAEFTGAAYQTLTSLDALAAEVTERQKAQNALRDDDRTKDEFIATLGHELRNPLAPIRHALEIVRRSRGDPAMAAAAYSIIERQIANMVRLIDDSLDVSRIRLGKLELMRTTVELSVVLTNAIESSRPVLDAFGHDLVTSLPVEPVYLYGDAMRLTQVFMNLLVNAAKYTKRGGRIWVSVQRDEHEIFVSVRDSGVGIAADRIGHIFTLFDQAGRSADTSEGGLGIGLHLVKRITEMHGGTVRACSGGPGHGSEFIVQLPVAAPGFAEMSRINPVAPVTVPPDYLRILVADDNEDAADSLATLLQLSGHTVETAYDGAQAVLIAESLRPQLVLLDLGMPKLSGVEAARHIRDSNWGKSMLLIALTGWSPSEVEKRGHADIFDAQLTKPVVLDSVLQLLRDLPMARAQAPGSTS
jgi:signal transduction histidine kinase/ActR/RegA family two-component response regulator